MDEIHALMSWLHTDIDFLTNIPEHIRGTVRDHLQSAHDAMDTAIKGSSGTEA